MKQNIATANDNFF